MQLLLATNLGQSEAAVRVQLGAVRQRLKAATGRAKITVTEAVYALGVTPAQWSSLRQAAWQPDGFIGADEEVSALCAQLHRRFRLAFGTNNAVPVGLRILELVGIHDAAPDVPVFGPENLGVSKPEPAFYATIAQRLGAPPAACLSVGDREWSDGPPALAAGYAAAIIVPGSRAEFVQAARCLLDDNWREELESYI